MNEEVKRALRANLKLLQGQLVQLCAAQNTALRAGAMDAYFQTGREIAKVKQEIQKCQSQQ